MNNYDYPPGADNSSAPWNKLDLDPIKCKVKIQLTLAKDIDIEVTNYKMISDEDEDNPKDFPDFTETDFISEVKEQVCMPHELAAIMKHYFKSKFKTMNSYLKQSIEDADNWKEVDINVTLLNSKNENENN